MLVLSRQRDESVVMGGPGTVDRVIDDPDELRLVLSLANGETDGALSALADLSSAVKKLIEHVNTPVRTTVVDIRGDKVRQGFVAPEAMPIHREEIYRRIHGEERSAKGV